MKHYLTTALGVSLLLLFSGCLGHLRDRPLSYRDYGHSGAVHAHYLEPACGEGCGEVYIGEWISTPPTPDPCDYSGNYTGAGNDLIYREHAQPVRTTLRKLAGVRFLSTRYATPWHATPSWYSDAPLDEPTYEEWSPEWVGPTTSAIPSTAMGNARPSAIPYRAAAAHAPACNCGH